jgi:hypothetical protein
MGLANVFGNSSREQAFASALKKVCSSVRNAFRQDVRFHYLFEFVLADILHMKIRDSIIGDCACSLAEFTFYTANKYWRLQFDEDMGFGFTIHNVLLVCSLFSLNIYVIDSSTS